MEKINKGYDSFILHINGGAGKNVMATCIVREHKKQFPSIPIIVVTYWEDIWLHNPYVDRVYTGDRISYFYDDFVKNKNPKICINDPYDHQDYILNKRHLIDVWSELVGIKFTGDIKPDIFFNKSEIESFKSRFKPTKPILFLQTSGGPQGQGYSWSRDIPTDEVVKIITPFLDDYEILHFRLPEQPEIVKDATPELTRREWMLVLMFSKKRLLIDSLAQHVASAFGMKSTVCWIGNNSDIVGYPLHDNIPPKAKPFIDTNKFSYLTRFNLGGSPEQCPYNNEELFDTNLIIKSIKEQ